jgi:DNA replication and repair protein RecF
VIQGLNGQGKSNLLEAVYMLSVAKSPRASQDRQLIGWELLASGGHAQILGVAKDAEQTCKIQVDFEVGAGMQMADVDASGNASVQKSLRVNGIKRTASEFVGTFNVVAFAVEDIELVTGGPKVRRRYLDILISQIDPAYLKALQRYQKVITQRNNMLRLIRERRAGLDELHFWDERLCEEGAIIIERRAITIDQLTPLAVQSHARLADGDDGLALEYLPELGQGEHPSQLRASEINDTLSQSLAVIRDREIARGVSMIGPHRDELAISLHERDAGSFSSRGQARTIALSLKLAEGMLVSDATGRSPVLALDDVLSELDLRRRRLVLEAASEYEQVFVTTTDFAMIEGEFLDRASKFQVEGGKLQSS